MATEALRTRTFRTVLDDGTDSDGKQMYVYDNFSFLGGISKDGWDADKALAIVSALESCLTRDVLSNETIATYTVSA